MGKRQLSPEKLERLQGMKRASKLRARLAAGKGGDKERAELRDLETRYRPKSKGTRPRIHDPRLDDRETGAQDEPVAPGPGGPPESSPDSAGPPPPLHGRAERPPRVPPEPPPPVDVLPSSGGANWRSKYRQALGRESACVQAASLYCSVLARMVAFVEAQGQKPVFNLEQIKDVVFPSAVLTADALLPANFEMRPEIETTIYSGIIVGQAFVVARRAKAAAARDPKRQAAKPSTPPPPESKAPANGAPPPDPTAPVHAPAPRMRLSEDSYF